MGQLKQLLLTILWSILVLGVILASVFVAPLLIGAGVVITIYVIIKILNTDAD